MRGERPVRHQSKGPGAHTATPCLGREPEAERGLVPVRAEPRDGSEQAIGGGIEDGERRAGAISPHRQGVLDEGVRVGGQ